MRRQTVLGEGPLAGSGCNARLDPLALPVRFTARDAVADGQVRHIEIDQGRMRVRRQVRGMTISVNVPVTAFLGVAVRRETDATAIRLEHRDPALSTTLCAAAEDAMSEGQAWADALGLPLLVDEDSRFAWLGALKVGAVGPRRRRRNAIKRRRSTMALRRRACPTQELAVIRGEREIIARN